MDLSPLFADRIPRVTYFPSRWACYFILTMNTSPFDSFLCFCFHILILRWFFFFFFLQGGGGRKGGVGWRRGGCRKGVHLASLHSRKHFFLHVCFISATYVSSQRSTSLRTQRTHAPHYHLVSPKTKQHGRAGVHFCTAVLVCCFSRGGVWEGWGGGV